MIKRYIKKESSIAKIQHILHSSPSQQLNAIVSHAANTIVPIYQIPIKNKREICSQAIPTKISLRIENNNQQFQVKRELQIFPHSTNK